MSLAITADEPRLSLPRRFVELLPGLALLLAIGFAGKLIEQSIGAYGKAHHLALPKIEYVLWAIIIGLIGIAILTLGIVIAVQPWLPA
jgi:hypothetical protein